MFAIWDNSIGHFARDTYGFVMVGNSANDKDLLGHVFANTVWWDKNRFEIIQVSMRNGEWYAVPDIDSMQADIQDGEGE